jgi:Meiotically Up-regulated Gene 113 (MUG113) protein
MVRSDATRTRIERGIRKDRYGYEAYVKAGGQPQRTRRFPPDTSLPTMRRWRAEVRVALGHVGRQRSFVPIACPPKKSLDGWCYVYVLQDGDHVKIGRTCDPELRLADLQTAHHRPLTLVCAVPAHAALERAIHDRFAHLKQKGEWFALDAALTAFIDAMAAGRNPVALLW